MTAPPQLGRPPLPPSQLRSKSLRVPLTQAEHRAIAQLARRLDTPAAEIMRDYALKRARRLGIKKETPEPPK